MEFDLGPEQRMLIETASRAFGQAYSISALHGTCAEMVPATAAWSRVADLGFPELLLDAAIPPGSRWQCAVAVLEAAGRHLVPDPLADTLVAARLLDRLAPGAALTEALRSGTARAVWLGIESAPEKMIKAEPYLHGYRFSGMLPMARIERADRVLLWAEVRDGWGLFVHSVEGLPATVRTGQDGLPYADVDLTGFIADSDIGMDDSTSVRTASIAMLATLHAAWAVGASQCALDLAVRYVGQRRQFGRLIGSFQAIQHQLADIQVAVGKARILTQYAADVQDRREMQEIDRNVVSAAAAMAFLAAAESLERAGLTGCLVHGGSGFMEDSDIQLFYRRSKEFRQRLACEWLWEHALGSASPANAPADF